VNYFLLYEFSVNITRYTDNIDYQYYSVFASKSNIDSTVHHLSDFAHHGIGVAGSVVAANIPVITTIDRVGVGASPRGVGVGQTALHTGLPVISRVRLARCVEDPEFVKVFPDEKRVS
jgi:hypothetical protein